MANKHFTGHPSHSVSVEHVIVMCGGIPPWFWVNPLLVSTCSNNCIRGQCAGGHGLRGSALPNKPFSQNTEHSTLPSRGQPATASPTKQQTFPNQFPCSALVAECRGGAGRGGVATPRPGPPPPPPPRPPERRTAAGPQQQPGQQQPHCQFTHDKPFRVTSRPY